MSKGSQRQVYKLPRSPGEIRINNYNPLLLILWKANMDIQFIAESTLAIAQYVTGYVTNAEKSNMQDLFGRRSPLTSRSTASCGRLVSGVCAPESVVCTRPAISS